MRTSSTSGIVATSALGEGGLGCGLGISVCDDAAALTIPEGGMRPDNSGRVDSAPGKGASKDPIVEV